MDRYTDTVFFDCTVNALAVHPDRRLLAAGLQDGTVKVLDTVRLAVVNTFKMAAQHPAGVRRLTASREHLATSGKDGEVCLWDWGGQLVTRVSGCHGPIRLTADGRHLVSTSGQRVLLWNTQTQTALQYQRHGHSITAVAVSPDGRLVASGDVSGTYMVYDVQSNTLLAEINHYRGIMINDMSFRPAGDVLCWTDNQGTVGYHPLAEIGSSRAVNLFVWAGHAHYGCEFNPSGDLIAAPCYDQRLYIFEYPSAARVEALNGHGRHATAAVWLSDDRVASASQDNTVRLWNVRRAHLVA